MLLGLKIAIGGVWGRRSDSSDIACDFGWSLSFSEIFIDIAKTLSFSVVSKLPTVR
jgi:hypothetical protein